MHLVMRLFLLALASLALTEEINATDNDEELAEVIVRASRVANIRPAGSYASLATTLRFDPQTELQSRGLPEGQADVTVHGGMFENTGFAIGATTIMDPQTGHYAAGLPVDPEFLSLSELQTGIDNAVSGFNSAIATVVYSLPAISSGGDVLFGIGNHNLRYSSLRQAKAHSLENGRNLAVAVSAALSEGDGTLPNGDHDFSRFNLHIQHSLGNAQTDVLIGYQDKFYAWPGAYTGFAFLAETDHTKTRLIHTNHRREHKYGWFEFSAYYRGLKDDYDFDRTTQETGTAGSFDHETRVYAAGVQGSYRHGAIDWRFGGQLTSDKLLHSTDLTEGNFTSRNYAKLSLVPSIDFTQSGNRSFNVRAGATLDTSNHDSSTVSPLLGLSVQQTNTTGSTYYAIEYASTSQLPGYTALNSRPMGLFGGNPELGREKARQLSVFIRKEVWDWTGSMTLFYRSDSDLVDWTFFTGVPFSRQANPVDLNVLGMQALFTRQWNSLNLVAGYTYLDKHADYGENDVDASFYALNFARHRATLALRYQLASRLELRLDNEYRVQEDNPLRIGKDKTYLASLALAWAPANIKGLVLTLTADNITDSDYQFFPGTPAVGRQLSMSAAFNW